MLAFDSHPARRWEPKRLRLRVFSAAGRLVQGGRRLRLRLSHRWKWAGLIATAITACRPFQRLDQHQPVPTTPGRKPPGPVEPATRRDSRNASMATREKQGRH